MKVEIELSNVICNVETVGVHLDEKKQPSSFFDLLCNDIVTDLSCKQDVACICRWCKTLQTLEENVNSAVCITEQVNENKQTILHCAAECVSPRKGLEVAVLSLCRKFGIEVEDLYGFVNQVDENGFTALRIATERNQKDLIVILLRNYADINLLNRKNRTRAVSLVSNQVGKELVHLFDSHLHIIPDKVDPYNEQMYKVNCDFGPVIGKYENFEETHHQTRNLATWLRRENTERENILLHPLMQIFLHIKGKQYKILRFISIIYHIAFYLGWAMVAHCEAHILNGEVLKARLNDLYVQGTRGLDANAKSELDRLEHVVKNLGSKKRIAYCTDDGFHFIAVLIYGLVLVNVVKEVFIFCMSGNRLYYLRRWQHIFQWILYLPAFYMTIKTFCKYSTSNEFETQFYIVFIFIAMALIQDQLSKFEIFGLHNEIFASGLKNLMRIGFAFLPFISAFSVTFSLLLPMNDEFQLSGFSKIASMMVGEINHDATFFPVNKPYTHAYYPATTQLWFFIFALAITLLFQNLVIAATISDVQKLKSEARANFLAHRFDDIYLIENIIMHPFALKLFTFVGWKSEIVKALNVGRNDEQSCRKRLDEYPKNLQNVIVEWQEKCRQGPYQRTKL